MKTPEAEEEKKMKNHRLACASFRLALGVGLKVVRYFDTEYFIGGWTETNQLHLNHGYLLV